MKRKEKKKRKKKKMKEKRGNKKRRRKIKESFCIYEKRIEKNLFQGLD